MIHILGENIESDKKETCLLFDLSKGLIVKDTSYLLWLSSCEEEKWRGARGDNEEDLEDQR